MQQNSAKDNELLTDAIIAASGGYHMTTAALNTSQDEKGFGVIQAEWYLNQNLPVNADLLMQNSTTKNLSLPTKNSFVGAKP